MKLIKLLTTILIYALLLSIGVPVLLVTALVVLPIGILWTIVLALMYVLCVLIPD